MREEPARLVGLAEMFDYKKRAGQMTIGYRINEAYWHRGIAAETVRMLIDSLYGGMGVQTLRA
ncbi:MAG: GNAT family N-acetyltransferase [Clostridiales bacterium]|nr:GNAT family N-acetyltransferase [Clostridiales bacterium]MDY2836145.1 GNAT family N-acetyltransferase [Candidatus Aphodomonas sp.]